MELRVVVNMDITAHRDPVCVRFSVSNVTQRSGVLTGAL